MPKLIDYPKESYDKCLELATVVDKFGGNASEEAVAKTLNRSHKSGSWSTLVGAAVKYGFVEVKNAVLKITPLLQEIVLAYDEREKQKYEVIAFLTPGLHQKIYDRFKGKELPVAALPNLLAKDLNVARDIASKCSQNFVDGATKVGLLVGNRLIQAGEVSTSTVPSPVSDNGFVKVDNADMSTSTQAPAIYLSLEKKGYSISIKGPDNLAIDLLLEEEEDFAILNATLNKIRKRLAEQA